jgi:hypothetical protein
MLYGAVELQNPITILREATLRAVWTGPRTIPSGRSSLDQWDGSTSPASFSRYGWGFATPQALRLCSLWTWVHVPGAAALFALIIGATAARIAGRCDGRQGQASPD